MVSTTNIYQGGIKHKLSGEEGVSTMNADKRQGRREGVCVNTANRDEGG